MRSEWRSFPLATITFLGERQDIFDPEAAELLPARRRTPDVLSPKQPTDDLPGDARQVGRAAHVTLR